MSRGHSISAVRSRRRLGSLLHAFAATAALAFSAQSALAQVCPAPSDVDIELVQSESFCELCGVGTVTVRVYYEGNNNPEITDLVIRQNLSAPGLVPVPNTTTVDVRFGAAPPPPTPTLVGGEWQWSFGSFELEPFGQNQFNAQYLELSYQVRRANGLSEEGLYSASKQITSSVSYSVGGPVCATDTDVDTLAFRRPQPEIIKTGRNVDASQSSGQYRTVVYGHNNDDVIWRIQIRNDGLAPMQDVRLDDLMASGNLVINYACPSDAAAAAIANNDGVAPPGTTCQPASNTVNNFLVSGAYGAGGTTDFGIAGSAANGFTRNLNGRDVDVVANGTSTVLYLVGKITANGSCISGGRTNTVEDLEFGCEADGGSAGGIDAGISRTAVLRTYHGDVTNGLTIERRFTGVNTVGTTTVSNRPVGARGLVTLTITNNTGGTVRDIYLEDVLPPEYVVDPTYWSDGFTKTLPVRGTPIAGESSIRPMNIGGTSNGAYPGMIDRLTWENPQGSLAPPSQDPLLNTSPRFRLWSSTQHPEYPDQQHLLRHGDVVTVTFPIVLISQDRNAVEPYDLVADLDVTPEITGDGTDPAYRTPLSNRLTVDYDTFCPAQGNNGAGHFTFALNDNSIDARPEDLDVAITDTSNNSGAVFILTNDPNQQLPLRVRLTNNGGHDATGYHAFVSFGATMEVVSAPAGCAVMPLGGSPPQPDPWKTWILPAPIPATGTVYHCTAPASIAPGQTVNLDFAVIKSSDPARIALDDLTFRADVVGEILLHDGTPLWFPTPITRPDGQLDRANNYSLDGVRQRVIGFNLVKSSLGCNENDPPLYDPGPNTKQAERVEIGEECTFRVRSGGWFGFETPGFLYIAVEDVELTDQLPAGQGYVSSTDPYLTSSSQIAEIALMGSSVPPTPDGLIAPGAPFSWTFNQTSRITQLDEWFQADVVTRVLNHPINARGAPNVHGADSANVLVSEFVAIFADENGVESAFDLGPSAVGYPNEPIRREDLTITEPMLTLVKEVCNETRYGTGPACSNWTTLADDGDAFNSYIYRIIVTNEAAAGGLARSPAYDVVVTDRLDPSGLACVLPFDSDGLDNDADGIEGAGDGDEGTVTDDCTPGVQGVVTFSHTHSTALQRIDAGESVTLYYRVDFDDDAAPLQTFTNSVTADYDTLAGSTNESGNQTVDPRPTGDIGGARLYTSDPASAAVRIIPVETEPKQIVRTSSTPATPPPGPQEVVIGEEIEYELTTLLPVALLRNFVIRDELPPGLVCAEAPAIDLDASPYADAGFQPGGVIEPVCEADHVEWSFGNQRITQGTTPDNRFPFSIRFIVRVENSLSNDDGDVLSNGEPATTVTARYIDEADNLVEHTFGQVDVLIREPVIELTKSFSAPEADAGDVLTVTVTATNTGTATAYNLALLDDLSGIELTYAGGIAGDDPPTDDLSTYGADRPLFTWPAGFGIAPGDSVTFTFDVTVDGTVEPHEVLTNTIEARWTSLPGRSTALNSSGQVGPDGSPSGQRNGALPNAGDALNDYEAEASADVVIRGPALVKEDLDPALTPTIGVHKPFRIDIELPEGTTTGLTAADDLAAGSVSYVLARSADFDVSYEFVGIDSINGLPPSEAAFNAVPADGASGIVTWDIGTVVTANEDDLAASALTPTIRIVYYARIDNDLETDAGDTVRNAATVTYLNGETGTPETLTDSTPPIAVVEPVLTATKALANVTPGKAPTDPAALDDILQYVVTIVNTGQSTAHDLNIVDVLPLELALHPDFAPVAEINGMPVPDFVSVPAGAPAGPLVWGRENGDQSLDLPPSGFLELTYQVVVRAPPDAGTALSNSVWTDWTSLPGESVYERTGAGCPTVTAPNDYCYGPAVATGDTVPLPPPAAAKVAMQPTAGIGETFAYRITIPAAPYAAPLYDVRITDDLAASAADLELVGVEKISGPGTWTPVNTGTATSVVIEDPVDGIDIPAGEQAVIEITVRLLNTPTNVDGLTFTNTAGYTYNRIDTNDASERIGLPGTSDPMTVVEPYLTLEKSGPPQMRIGLPGTFTLNVHNPTLANAYGITLTDVLPSTPAGGMCDAPPSAFTAQRYAADGTTPLGDPLVEGTDFAVAFEPAPVCTFTLTTSSAAAVIGPDERLIVTYQAMLDASSEQDAVLTNVAGATRWASAYASDQAREHARVLTDGTEGVLDHEDAHTVVVNLPVLRFEKTVANVSRGENPATLATPGETLRYTLRIENLSDVELTEFSVRDELDGLNDPPAFAAGTLTLITVPDGADVSNTSATGGAAGTGLVDVRNLSLGGLGDQVVLEYEVRLAPVRANGSYVENQASILTGGFPLAASDDPNRNGQDDPTVPGDEDPTRIEIQSAPRLQVLKISTDLTGDPNVLLAGETLRYTLTVRNVGTDHASEVTLRDAVPANTTYVAGSTTLNGMPVPDGPGGLAPLADGILIHAPNDPTPGVLRADPSAPIDGVATIEFDVVIYPDVLDGTVISNQGFVSSPPWNIFDQPSDDPRTPVPDDPTRDVVGNAPLLYAEKRAALEHDAGTPNIVDPGDVLRYTITIYNNGPLPATEVVLRDQVPENTTYVADSLTLNGDPYGPDGGVSPLVGGLPVSSSDLTPPLPGPGEGVLSRGEAAVVEFQLRVNDGVPPGTLIVNQAVVETAELPNLLTDGDGNPATGPEPTVVVVGDVQQLTITKQVAVVGGGPALPGETLEYLVTVTNIGAVPAYDVVIRDDIAVPVPNHLMFVADSWTMNGTADGIEVVDSLLTADYSGTYGALEPGRTITLRFRATLYPDLAMGTRVTNTATVYWNDPVQTASASVSIDVGGTPGMGILNGRVWHDFDFDILADEDELPLEGWTVELYRNDQPIRSTQTDAAGMYRLAGLLPNYETTDRYELRFVRPGAGPNTAMLGRAHSDFTNDLQRISDIVVISGANLQDLNLPIDPNGVVYDSLQRTPIAGATLTMVDAASGTPLPASCFYDPAMQDQVTLADGYYKFDLSFADAACPSGGAYAIRVTPPSSAYIAGVSEIIPPASSEATAPFVVPSCPAGVDDAVPTTSSHCEAAPSPLQPPSSVEPRSAGTRYHLHVVLDDSFVPGTSQLYNNHIALDLDLDDSVTVTKTTPLLYVSRGQLVPYVITVTNGIGVNLPDVAIVDRLPPGFRYIEGSARLNGVPTEPEVVGRELVFSGLTVTPDGRHTIQLLMGVGSGVGEGEFVNRAQAMHVLTGNALSGEATATVRIVPDPLFDCTDVLGKVFDDANRNGLQDDGERGIPGVRIATARGLVATTDQHGRFHITCAITPREGRGSNFVVKLDDRTLPTGFRPSTETVQVKRATRGKAIEFNFGASIHRVIGLDLADPVFEPGTADLREIWRPRIDLLVAELGEAPAVLRLSYLADLEDPRLVDRRLAAVRKAVLDAWTASSDCCAYSLEIETEVFWRRGSPPDGAERRVREGRGRR